MNRNPDPAALAEGGHRYLVVSDFDQTLSFNDSGQLLAEMLGIHGFHDKIAGLSRSTLVNQGAELAYLLRHDPEFRGVRREHLHAVGKQVPLKDDVRMLGRLFEESIGGNQFDFYVISAAPREVVQSALEGIVPPERVFGAEFRWDDWSGEIGDILRVPAGYGKVAVLQELEARLHTSPDRTIYVMHHVNSRDGFTVAVSKAKSIGRIARRTVLSDNALSVLIPILEDLLGWDARQIRGFFSAHGLALQDWDKIRTDWLTFHHEDGASAPTPHALALAT